MITGLFGVSSTNVDDSSKAVTVVDVVFGAYVWLENEEFVDILVNKADNCVVKKESLQVSKN